MAKSKKSLRERRAERVAEARANPLTGRRARFMAHLYSHLVDHAWLRVFWTNFYPVAPGVYRSNQPSPRHVAGYAERGIKAVLNLRSETGLPFHRLEVAACKEHGIELWELKRGFSARRAPKPRTLLKLLRLMDEIPRPFVMHCKSGADRAGLASALYLIAFEGQRVDQALKQLSLRYVHLSRTSTGIMDHFLRYYAFYGEARGIELRDWIKNHYDPAKVTASFADWRRGHWPPAPDLPTADKPQDEPEAA